MSETTYKDPIDIALEETTPAVSQPLARVEEPRRPHVVRELPTAAPKAETLTIMAHSPEIGQLIGALAAAQGEFGEVERTLEAKIATRSGPGYTYEYESLADVLAAVRPALSKQGLALMQFPFTRQASVVVRTLVAHSSGQWIYNELVASIVDTAPQSIGSGITFLRRYAVKSMLGLAAGHDDDGATASRPAPEPVKPAQRKSEQAAKPAESAPAPAPATPPAPVGVIVNVQPVSGGAILTLDTGFRSGTRKADVIAAAEKFAAAKQRVELVTTPPKDPSKFAPAIVEIRPIDRTAGEEG